MDGFPGRGDNWIRPTKYFDNEWIELFVEQGRIFLSDRATRYAFYFLLFILFLGVFGNSLAPYHYEERHRTPSGELDRLASPSLAHPLGTTQDGYDVLSRLIIGTQPTIVAGFIGGLIIISIGATVGLVSGYVGGRVEQVLMRITDFFYGIPLIPLAIVLLAFFGIGFFKSVLVIGLVVWRGSARVIRSQVLQIREREYVKAAEVLGASKAWIIARHIFPNVVGMAILFFSIGVGVSIKYQASLAFLGMSSPFQPSWGVMIRNAYNSGFMAEAWWWSLPPGLMISFTVLSALLIGRGTEVFGEGEQNV